jgi:fermentation-respiration switch protein FrsA (DUF1100 family)
VNPWQQVEDYRHGISYARSLDVVDSDRIGIWGTSYSGGHVLMVAAIDKRVKVVVSQVPLVSGKGTFERLVVGPAFGDLLSAIEADREAQFAGEAPLRIPVVAKDLSEPCALPGREGYDFLMEAQARGPAWRNEVTMRSADWGFGWEPGFYVERISPAPLLMILATHDTLTPTDISLEVYQRALEPKKLFLVPGGHFEPYVNQFEIAADAARDWFVDLMWPARLCFG